MLNRRIRLLRRGDFKVIGFLGFTYSPDKKFNQRAGHGNQVIFVIRMKPGIDDLIHRADNKAFNQTHIKILTDGPLLLTLFYNFRNNVTIHLGHFLNLGFGQAAVLVGFNLIDNGHVPVALEFFQMHPNEIAKLVQAGIGPIHLRTETIKYLLGFIIEKLDQNIVFILEIKIDGAVGDAGFFGNLGNGRLMKSLSGKNLDSRFKNLVIFMIFFDPVNDRPVLGLRSFYR